MASSLYTCALSIPQKATRIAFLHPVLRFSATFLYTRAHARMRMYAHAHMYARITNQLYKFNF